MNNILPEVLRERWEVIFQIDGFLNSFVEFAPGYDRSNGHASKNETHVYKKGNADGLILRGKEGRPD